MKALLLPTLLIVFTSLAQAQIKGTNTLGLGISSSKTESESSIVSLAKNTFLSLEYGNFIKDNTRLAFEISYGLNKQQYRNSSDQNTTSIYGGAITYQKYYPLWKKLYAYAGGRAGYSYSKQKGTTTDPRETIGNNYNLGADGGITWFLSKRIALSSALLSADASYYKQKSDLVNSDSESSGFNLTTTGSFNNLGFKIYFLF